MARNIHNYRNVKLLVCDDDCSIDNPRLSTGRRGLAGIHLVNKIAGAMSVNGASVSEIHDLCGDLLRNRLIRTIGFSFHHDKTNALTDIEIGYGIHGEPGSIKLESERNFKPIIGIMKEKLRLNDVKSDVVILFNNLGGASEYIFYQFVREFMELMSGLPLRIVRVYAGKFLTSLSKEALSVTMMEVREAVILDYLAMPVDLPCGHLFNVPLTLCEPRVLEFELPRTSINTNKVIATSDEALRTQAIIINACEATISSKNYLNEIDGDLGDGDTGTTIKRGAESLLSEIKAGKLNVNSPCEMLLQISEALMSSMGGTSGAIFAIFFQCASKAFALTSQHTVASWINGMSMGMSGIMLHGKADVGDRTLVDALNSGLEAMVERSQQTGNSIEALRAFVDGCREGTEATKTMKPKSGRASYSLSDKDNDYNFISNHPDPGAHAIFIIADSVLKTFLSKVL